MMRDRHNAGWAWWGPACALAFVGLSGCLAQQADLVETRIELDKKIAKLDKKEREIQIQVDQANKLIEEQKRQVQQLNQLGIEYGALRREVANSLSALPGKLTMGLGRRLLTEDLAMDVRLQYTLLERPAARRIPPPDPPVAPVPVIVGTGECGSTLLRLMLDRHPDLAMAADGWFLPDLMQIWDDVPQPQGPMLGRLLADPAEIDRLLHKGAEQARAVASPIMADVRRVVGFAT